MALIPKQDVLTEKMECGVVYQKHRPYMGMSGLGGDCQRKIWYDFHWTYNRFISKRLARIFERGNLEEIRICNDLAKVGAIVTDDQLEMIDDTGHIKGHIDGKVIGVPGAEKTEHLLEIKTMNSKRFKDYIKKGLKETNPVYWVQAHLYMGELGLKRCLFVVTNKDNEERKYERIHFDPAVHSQYMAIGFSILVAEYPPERIGERTWFACKFCDAKDICHNKAEIKKTCRSCEFCDLEVKGKWACQKTGSLSEMEQLNACSKYELSEVYD